MSFEWQGRSLVVKDGKKEVVLNDLACELRRPFYVYDLEEVRIRARRIQALLPQVSIRYAVKANCCPAILESLSGHGVGADVVSGGELRLALAARMPPESIVFSGVGKEIWEIEFALSQGIGQINAESLPEIQRIARIARQRGMKAPLALRINPNIDAQTHPYISTGLRENKFGLPEDQLVEAFEILSADSTHLEWKGFAVHLGSQIENIEVFRQAFEFLVRWCERARVKGLTVPTIDLGGGFPVSYEHDDLAAEDDWLREYARILQDFRKDLPGQILIEPGRFMVARAGLLLTEVQYVKRTASKTFVIVNSGMNHLLRPALYGARHRISPIQLRPGATEAVSVVGPICESADVWVEDLALPPIQEGDWLAVWDVGAYGAVMASTYNARELPAEVVVEGGRWSIVHES